MQRMLGKRACRRLIAWFPKPGSLECGLRPVKGWGTMRIIVQFAQDLRGYGEGTTEELQRWKEEADELMLSYIATFAKQHGYSVEQEDDTIGKARAYTSEGPLYLSDALTEVMHAAWVYACENSDERVGEP